MKFKKIEEVMKKQFVGKKVSLRGWVSNKRVSKTIMFLILRDSSNKNIQCSVKKDSKAWGDAQKITQESSIEVKGKIVADERAPGGFELLVESIRIIGLAERYPINRDKSTEFLLDKRHLWIRSDKMKYFMKVRAQAFKAAREFFEKKGFYEVTGPEIVSTKGEEGGSLFSFKYFGKKAYLSQTNQMHLEAMIYSLERVYSLQPSFRAEKSRTRKHVTEYWHLEGEAAWVDNEENMRIIEELVKHVCHSVARNCKEELVLLGQDPKYLLSIKTPFKRITYEQAIRIIQKKGGRIEYGDDFGVEHERLLTEDESQPIFITSWPRKMKAFYMKVDDRNPELVKCADLQAPKGFGELVGSSQREEDIKVIIENLKREGDDPKKYEWYLDLRRFGTVPHSGFGLGMSRLLMWLTNAEHIRDVIPFPRTPTRMKP